MVKISGREIEEEAPLPEGLHDGFWGGDLGITRTSGEFLRGGPVDLPPEPPGCGNGDFRPGPGRPSRRDL
ncbi:MAG: hypothetical protein A2139_09175 [Desulfobacca sp. RBG_16_60_12]|nr:MAG: hypothetical protein A2139_09175 [Desulfobacca sp. RBG_16_60_12]